MFFHSPGSSSIVGLMTEVIYRSCRGELFSLTLQYEADFVMLLLILIIACHNEIKIALLVLFRDILS